MILQQYPILFCLNHIRERFPFYAPVQTIQHEAPYEPDVFFETMLLESPVALCSYPEGGFEHYRLHRPDVTKGGLRRALVPTVVLEMIESEFELRYLPIAVNDAGIAAAAAAIAAATANATTSASSGTAGRKAAVGSRLSVASQRVAADTGDASGMMPLMVHLSHKGAGDRFFRNALHALEIDTCGGSLKNIPPFTTAAAETKKREKTQKTTKDQKTVEEDEKAREGGGGGEGEGEGSVKGGGCMLWCSGSQKDFRQNVHSFTFESPMPRAMRLLGRPYRAVFVVRDPRDLIAEAYLEHLNTSEAWARLPRAELGGDSFQSRLRAMSPEEGINLEIDRFTASLGLQLGLQRVFGMGGIVGGGGGIGSGGGGGGGIMDNRVGEFARSLRAFAMAADPNVRFVRYEDILAARAEGFELMGKWFGLKGSSLRSFVLACGKAQAEALGLGDEVLLEGMPARERSGDLDHGGGGGGGGGGGSGGVSKKTAVEEAWCDGGAGCEERTRRERMVLPPGAWREHFSEGNAERFERAHGTLLRGMGYLSSKPVATQ